MNILSKGQTRLDAILGVGGMRLAQNFNFEAEGDAVFALTVVTDQRCLKPWKSIVVCLAFLLLSIFILWPTREMIVLDSRLTPLGMLVGFLIGIANISWHPETIFFMWSCCRGFLVWVCWGRKALLWFAWLCWLSHYLGTLLWRYRSTMQKNVYDVTEGAALGK